MIGAYHLYDLQAYVLIFARMGGAMVLMPILGEREIPPHIRIFIALGFAITLTPFLYPLLDVPDNLPPPTLAILTIRENVIGLAMGAIARTMYNALDYVGNIISLISGLSSAMIFNPAMGTQTSLTSTFLLQVGTIILLTMDMHHLIIKGIAHSYTLVGLFKLSALNDCSQVFTQAVDALLKTGLQLAFPFLLVNMILQFMLGVASRVVPQLQIFFVAMPLQTLITFFVLFAVLGSFMATFAQKYYDFFTAALQMR
jgi:flagellar biosynthetic protein FliR